MPYSKFSLKDAKDQLGLQLIEDQQLFHQVAPVSASEFLQLTLKKHVPLALAVNTEKARSEWIIAPVLAELRELLPGRISVFSGKKFDVEPERGLDGFCDYLVSRSPEQYYICAPVLAIVEAKNENIIDGLGQCLATMCAAALFNTREQQNIPYVYGAVTTGTVWKFLKLQQQTAWIDADEYYLNTLDELLGIFITIIQ
jgi:hypothetical protein